MDYTIFERLDVNAYVADENFSLLYMNEKARAGRKNSEALIGASVLGCHKEKDSEMKIEGMFNEFANGRKEPYVYTIPRGSKLRQKVLLPLFEETKFAGVLLFTFNYEE